ncbi:MAG: hypothetical protein JXA16_04775, partial [Bacteroidales bacterium]|nr:hypothetical protein [Bacteroidales bacterium]
EFDNKQIILYSSSFLFAINPFFNKRLLQIFNNNLQLALNQLNINANSFFLLKIFQIKTFVFSRKKLIGSGEYILDNFIQRHTQKRETVLNIAASLFKLWQSNFFEIIESEMENQADIIDLEIIIKNNEGIIVNDKNENEYILGFYSFIKEFSEVKNTHTFYLLKNKIIAGKFNVFEKTNTNNLLIVNILNKYGNTVLLNNDDKINFNSDVVEFDKTYFCEDVEQEKDILNKLNSKAPTAFFTKNKTLISQADLTFHIADNTASDENNENYLSLPESKINEIENLMLLTKKVHIWLNYALLIFVSINILMLIFAAFFYMYPILILSLNITISVIYMLVFNKMPFKSKLKKY